MNPSAFLKHILNETESLEGVKGVGFNPCPIRPDMSLEDLARELEGLENYISKNIPVEGGYVVQKSRTLPLHEVAKSLESLPQVEEIGNTFIFI